MSVCVSVHRSVVERLRPQFFTDFHQILHTARKFGCFEDYGFWDKPEVDYRFAKSDFGSFAIVVDKISHGSSQKPEFLYVKCNFDRLSNHIGFCPCVCVCVCVCMPCQLGKLVRLHTANCGNTVNRGYPQLIIVDILAAEGPGSMLLAGNVYADVGGV